MLKCRRTRVIVHSYSPPFFFLFLSLFLLSLSFDWLALEMAPHYGSPNPDQVLALSSTVVGVGPGGNTSMVA